MFLSQHRGPSSIEVIRSASLESFSGVYVFREPVAQARSWYVSTRYTHPLTPTIIDIRSRLEGLCDVEAMQLFLAEYYDSVVDPIEGWSRFEGSGRMVPIQFENLVGDPTATLHCALNVAGWELEKSRLQRVVGSYRLERFRPRFNFGSKKYLRETVSDADLPMSAVDEVVRNLRPDVFDLFEDLQAKSRAFLGES